MAKAAIGRIEIGQTQLATDIVGQSNAEPFERERKFIRAWMKQALGG